MDIQYLCYCDWLIFLSLMSSRFTHVVAYCKFHSFSRLGSIPPYVYTTLSLFILLATNIQVVVRSWLLWVLLQWTWECQYVQTETRCLWTINLKRELISKHIRKWSKHWKCFKILTHWSLNYQYNQVKKDNELDGGTESIIFLDLWPAMNYYSYFISIYDRPIPWSRYLFFFLLAWHCSLQTITIVKLKLMNGTKKGETI